MSHLDTHIHNMFAHCHVKKTGDECIFTFYANGVQFHQRITATQNSCLLVHLNDRNDHHFCAHEVKTRKTTRLFIWPRNAFASSQNVYIVSHRQQIFTRCDTLQMFAKHCQWTQYNHIPTMMMVVITTHMI